MKYVSVSYTAVKDFYTPESWLKRIEGYMGILENLARENTVHHINQINYEGEFYHGGVHHHFVNFRESTFFPVGLHRFVKRLDPDVVIVQGLHYPLQVIQLRLALKSKIRIIAHHHAELPFAGIKKYAQRLADRYIDAYLFASFNIGREWVKKGNLAFPEKIHEVMEVSSNFHPLDKACAKQQTNVSGEVVFLWVGRLNQNKDPLTVVRAFLKYLEVNPGARLYMIYHTAELLGEITTVLNNDPSKDSVILKGQVPHDELLYWFNSADFFISGSHYEGSGTAVCEAMSCGCIPIVTAIFSFNTITDNGRCGLLYEPGDENGLLAALTQTRSLNVQEKQLHALNQFRDRLSFPAIANKIHQIALSLTNV
ncbi:MAG: glycosyltransferase family 4 protein [Mucilaginibacter sp.]